MILYSLWSDYYLDRNENQNQKNPCVLVYYRGPKYFNLLLLFSILLFIMFILE